MCKVRKRCTVYNGLEVDWRMRLKRNVLRVREEHNERVGNVDRKCKLYVLRGSSCRKCILLNVCVDKLMYFKWKGVQPKIIE